MLATSRFHRIVLLSALVVLSACAGDVSKPVAVQEIAPAQVAGLQVFDVTGEAQPGVVMEPADLDRVVATIRAALASAALSTASGPAARVRLVFTQYDKGDAGLRFLLAGLGQIKIDADVYFVDAAGGQPLGQYKVSKQFAFGGIYGASTTVEDVEKGFAKSVAEILKPKT